MIVAVRTTLGREEAVLEKIAQAARKFGYRIYAVFLPKDVKGYVFVEAASIDDVQAAIRGVNHARGIVGREIDIKEVEHFLEAKPVEIKISKGDIVEIVSEPFKGEKGKVIRVDKIKREITVEMIESAVPIPVTIPLEAVRLVKSGE